MASVRTIYYYVIDTLADWEPAYALALLHTPIGDPLQHYRVVTVAERSEPITTMAGMQVIPELTLDQLAPEDSSMLVLPGGATWETGRNAAAIEKAAELLQCDVPVAAICGATWGMARGGLLDDRQHTSNAPDYLASTGYRGQAFYKHERAVSDRNVITA